jgi:hypothetical protein
MRSCFLSRSAVAATFVILAACGSDESTDGPSGPGGAGGATGGSGGISGSGGAAGSGGEAGAGATSGGGGTGGAEGGTGGQAGQAGSGGSGPQRKTTSLGMGLSGIADWSTQYPFLDFMKSSRRWQNWDAGGAEISTVDGQGWVTSLQPGERAGTVFLTTPDEAPVAYERFVVRWEGTGEVSYTWGASKVGTAHGGDLVEVGTGSCLLRIDTTDPSDPIRRITIVPEQHVDAFDAGAVFNPDWLERMRDFRAIRFMDWMATNGSEQQAWSGRPAPSDRTFATDGVPVEVMVALANELNADPWFNMPHQADDGYVRSFAEVVRDALDPHLVAYVEHSNEVWNWGFAQAHYALEEGHARWGDEHGDAFMQWHGMRTAQICDIWKGEVFAGASTRVHCTLGTQAGWRGLEEPAILCPLWAAEGNAPCVEHGIDSLAITGYFSGCLHDDGHVEQMRGWFDDADEGMTKGMEQLEDAAHFDCGDSVAGNADTYAYFVQVVQDHGIALVAYEGGQHITGNGHAIQDDPDFIAFHIGLNRDLRMKDRYLENFENWKAAGGTLFMHFVDISYPSKYGSWGALEYLLQPGSPKWDAIVEFNEEDCFWGGC